MKAVVSRHQTTFGMWSLQHLAVQRGQQERWRRRHFRTARSTAEPIRQLALTDRYRHLAT